MAWVTAPSNLLMLHFRDDAGKHSVLECYLSNTETDPAGGGAAAISNAAAAISDSALYETEILIVALQNSSASFTTGPYDRPSDKVQYEFGAADGSLVHLQLGAPVAAQFTNGWDVDLTNTAVLALQSAMRTNAVTQEGAAILNILPSHRRRPPRRKQQ